MQIQTRDVPPRAAWALEQSGVHPLLARLLAARGVRAPDELDDGLARLLPPDTLQGSAAAARLLAEAIQAGRRICVVADYDCDGATACAVALRGLRLLGAEAGQLGYVVPDRAVHGYGLTPAIVDLALAQQPDLLVTVDNGIASLAGVAHARAAGLQVGRGTRDARALVLPLVLRVGGPARPAAAAAPRDRHATRLRRHRRSVHPRRALGG